MKSFIIICLIWIISLDLTLSTDNTGNPVKENRILKVDCPLLTKTENSLSFTSPMDVEEMGFSVELIFDQFVDILEANDSRLVPANIFKVSSKHWIISITVIRGKTKTAEFRARYALNNNNKEDVNLVGVIYNGETVCGEGKAETFTPKQHKYDGRRECIPSEQVNYEHETIFRLKEDFYSDKIGLAVDIFFSVDVDSVDPHSNVMAEKYDERHYMFFNSGYITSKDKQVEISFQAYHQNLPPPKLAAIVINNEVICGFATFYDVVKIEEEEKSDDFLSSLDVLAMSSNIITACSLLVAIVTGIFAWKLATSQISTLQHKPSIYSEPVYAMPHKNR